MPTPRPHPPDLSPSTAGPLTALLYAARAGRAGAADDLANAVYAELRTLAAGHLRHERPDHTLQPTALVHEAYLRLMGPGQPAWRDRAHFFRVAARIMRHVLVDYARQARAAKRDAVGGLLALDDPGVRLACDGFGTDAVLEIERVHDTLDALAALDARQARLVELRFFVGLTIEEAADVLHISRGTAVREWALARAWLAAELHGA